MYSAEELKFMEENEELLEGGATSELYKALCDYDFSTYLSKYKFFFLIGFLTSPQFIKTVAKAENPTSAVIQGVYLNLTGLKAKGQPLLPSNFTAKTKVILYKIDKYKIVASEKYTLSTREAYNDIITKKGYNLVIGDKPELENQVKEIFNGTQEWHIDYNLFFGDRNFHNGKTKTALGKSLAEVKQDLTVKLYYSIKESYFQNNSDFDSVIQKVANQGISQL